MMSGQASTHLWQRAEYKLPRLYNAFKVTAYLYQVVFFGTYFTFLWRGKLKTQIPMISDSIASQPFSGIFNLVNIPATACGFLGCIIFYVKVKILNKRLNIDKKDVFAKISFANKINLVLGFLSYLGISVGAAFPLDFHKGSEEWTYVTFYPHSVGAVLTFIGFILSYTLSSYILSTLQPEKIHSHGRRISLIVIMCVLGTMGAFCLIAFSVEGDTLEKCTLLKYFTPGACCVILPLVEWSLNVVLAAALVFWCKDLEDVKITIHVSLDEDQYSQNHILPSDKKDS